MARRSRARRRRRELPDVLLTPEPRFVYSNSVAWYPQARRVDYATATMRLTVPSEYQVVASGTLLRASLAPIGAEAGDRRRDAPSACAPCEYRADRPVRYLACVISRFVPVGQLRAPVPALAPAAGGQARVGADAVAGRATPGVNIEVVATPRQSGRNRALPAQVADVLQFYARTLGEAPYPDFTLAGVDDNLPGGHSPAYFALLQQPLPTTPYSWASDPVAFDNFSNFFLAHEIAHQWWGQAVGWKNYHEQWLSEGLAQYFAAAVRGARSRSRRARAACSAQMRASAIERRRRGPIYLGYRLGQIQNDARVFRAIVYNKSAVVLHMLRRLIGDEAFYAGLRRFYTTGDSRRPGTDDFRAAFEAETRACRSSASSTGGSWTRPCRSIRVTTRDDDGGAAAVCGSSRSGSRSTCRYTVTIQYQDGRQRGGDHPGHDGRRRTPDPAGRPRSPHRDSR